MPSENFDKVTHVNGQSWDATRTNALETRIDDAFASLEGSVVKTTDLDADLGVGASVGALAVAKTQRVLRDLDKHRPVAGLLRIDNGRVRAFGGIKDDPYDHDLYVGLDLKALTGDSDTTWYSDRKAFYAPYITIHNKAATNTRTGTWTLVASDSRWPFASSGGVAAGYYHTVTSDDTLEATIPANATRIGGRIIADPNKGGIAVVEIDDDPTAATLLPTAQQYVDRGLLASSFLVANGGPLNPTDRILDYNPYAYSISGTLAFDVHVPMWEGEASGSPRTLKLTRVAAANIATGLSYSVDSSTDVFTAAGHGYSDGNTVKLGTVPSGSGLTAASQTYYVRDATTDTFKVSLTNGGAAVNVTASGSGFVQGAAQITAARMYDVCPTYGRATDLSGGDFTAATLTFDPTGNNNALLFTSKREGSGIDITFRYTGSSGAATSVAVTPNATGGAAIVCTVNTLAFPTSAEVLAVLNGESDVTDLVTVAHAPGNDGTGQVNASLNTTKLTGGSELLEHERLHWQAQSADEPVLEWRDPGSGSYEFAGSVHALEKIAGGLLFKVDAQTVTLTAGYPPTWGRRVDITRTSTLHHSEVGSGATTCATYTLTYVMSRDGWRIKNPRITFSRAMQVRNGYALMCALGAYRFDRFSTTGSDDDYGPAAFNNEDYGDGGDTGIAWESGGHAAVSATLLDARKATGNFARSGERAASWNDRGPQSSPNEVPLVKLYMSFQNGNVGDTTFDPVTYAADEALPFGGGALYRFARFTDPDAVLAAA